MSFLSNLEWRYATKLFDATKKLTDEDLTKIIEAIRLTPTSFGLQPYHFYIVSNQEIKDKIQAVAWNQPQVGTASHVIVFAARTDLMKNKDEYFSLISEGSDEVRSTLKGYEDMVTGFINSRDEAAALTWASKQVYIAHGFALAAVAELQIDSCPMEGFDPSAVGEIIGIPENEKVLVILPIGYRAPTDGPRTPQKLRFSRESLFTEVK